MNTLRFSDSHVASSPNLHSKKLWNRSPRISQSTLSVGHQKLSRQLHSQSLTSVEYNSQWPLKQGQALPTRIELLQQHRQQSISSASADSTQSSRSSKSWIQNIFGGKPTDQKAERERVEMWRIMSMGYENVGQYVDVGEWIGR